MEKSLPYFTNRDSYYSNYRGKTVSPKDVDKCVQIGIKTLTSIAGAQVNKYLNMTPIIYMPDDSYPSGYPEHLKIKTMATDGAYIYIYPDFVWELVFSAHAAGYNPYLGIAYVLLHEVYHNFLAHSLRGASDSHDHNLQNIAMDYEVNITIESYYRRILHGMTDTMGGCLSNYPGPIPIPYKDRAHFTDHPFFGRRWEMFIDEIPTPSQEQAQPPGGEGGGEGDGEDDPQVKELKDKYNSSDFQDGYRDGWNEEVNQAIEDGLILATTELTKGSFRFKFASTNTSYDEGYDYGKKKAHELIDRIRNPQKGKSSGSGGNESTPDLRSIPQIAGLKPIIVPKEKEDLVQSQSNDNTDPNAPIRRESDSQQGGEQGGQQGGGGYTRGLCNPENTGIVISKERGQELLDMSGYLGQDNPNGIKQSKGSRVFTPERMKGNLEDVIGKDIDDNKGLTDLFDDIRDHSINLLSMNRPVVNWQNKLSKLLQSGIEKYQPTWIKSTVVGKHRTYDRDTAYRVASGGTEVAIFIDTSGSMGNALLTAVGNEIMNVCVKNNLKLLRIFTFTSKVESDTKYNLYKQPKPDLLIKKSSGCTNISCVFDTIRNEYERKGKMKDLNAVIVFTDDQLPYDLEHGYLPDLYRIDWGKKLIFVAALDDYSVDSSDFKTKKCTIIPIMRTDLTASVGL